MPSAVSAARTLQPRIRAAANEAEQQRRMSPGLAHDLAEAGLFRMLVPRSVGGLELDVRAILEAISRGDGPDETLIAMGYAGWSAGQLEEEMQHNAWLSGPAAPELLFHVAAERRWHDAAALLGVDLALLSGDVGHA